MRFRAFAAAVMARHAARGSRPSRALLVLLRARMSSIRVRAGGARHIHQRWAVNVGLHVAQPPATAGTSSRMQRTLTRSAGARQRMAARQEQRGHPTVPARAEPLRLVTRRPVPHAPAPAPRALRRSAPRERPPSSPSPDTRTADRVRETIPAQARVPLAALPAGELDRVTDHVIRNLDRRLNSWRERRGKS